MGRATEFAPKGGPKFIQKIGEGPFERIVMDIVGPLPWTKAGNKYILVIVDHAILWPEAIPLRTTDSHTVTDQLVVLFMMTVTPLEILIDCGTNLSVG